jgi:hypothetical protein
MIYSVDRRGFYAVGGTLGLFKRDPRPGAQPFLNSGDNWFSAADLAAHVEALYPDGLSLHGWEYMTWRLVPFTEPNSRIAFTPNERAIELVFEYVRAASFPKQPSRFQSYFGWESLDEARIIATQSGRPIYRIESDRTVRLDMQWLGLSDQNAIASYQAHKYWSGVATPQPKWEVLMVSPVRVVETIV